MIGVKELQDVRMGDTLTSADRPAATPHPGYKELKPFVFAGIYPVNPGDYDNLKKALDKMHLTDSAFSYHGGNIHGSRFWISLRVSRASASGYCEDAHRARIRNSAYRDGPERGI